MLFRITSSFLAAVFFILFLCPQINIMAVQSDSENVLSLASQKNVIDIKNFGKIDDDFYRGGQPKDYQVEELSKLGIKSIINLRLPNGKRDSRQEWLAKKFNMNYYNIPMTQFFPPNYAQISRFNSIVDDPTKRPVFVHCEQGQDRTGIITALYRARYYNWTYEQAYSEMLSYGYHSRFFPLPKLFLRHYIESLQPHNRTN